jgi:hypothetical protein
MNLAKTGASNVTLAYDSSKNTWTPTISGTQNPSSLAVVDSSLPGYAVEVYCSDGQSLRLQVEESLVSSGVCPTSATSTPASIHG